MDEDCSCADSFGRLPFGCFCKQPSGVDKPAKPDKPNDAYDDDDDDEDDGYDTKTVVHTRDDLDSRAPSTASSDSNRTPTPPRGVSHARPKLHQMGRGISMARVRSIEICLNLARASNYYF